MLAEVGRHMLERLGYRATSVTSVDEALALFRENPASFDLVLTDQTMPKTTGLELSRQLLAIRPELPIVLATGFSRRISENAVKAAGVKRLLMKPLVFNDLALAVRESLDSIKRRR